MAKKFLYTMRSPALQTPRGHYHWLLCNHTHFVVFVSEGDFDLFGHESMGKLIHSLPSRPPHIRHSTLEDQLEEVARD